MAGAFQATIAGLRLQPSGAVTYSCRFAPPMKDEPPNRSGRRVSLRMIARAARVSLMTVSYALRDSAEISLRERRRIQLIAAKMKYRPDPLLSHLMQHLRSGRTTKAGSNLAVIADDRGGFVNRQIAGASARAHALGYHLDRIHPESFESRPGALTRVLAARGIAGVLFAGRSTLTDCENLLDWKSFATIAMTYSITRPRMHRVVTHHFDNAVHTFGVLAERGFKRIGLAMTPDMEIRTNHTYAAAFSHSARLRGQEPIPTLFLGEGNRPTIASWFKRFKPDAIVVANAIWVVNFIRPILGDSVCRRLAIVTLDTEPEYPIAGIDQVYEVIGGYAVDGVVAQIHRNERGLPEMPVVTMVEGRWDEREGLFPFGLSTEKLAARSTSPIVRGATPSSSPRSARIRK